MAQQNLNIGLSREQIRAAVQADFVELYAALNSAYGTNLVPRLLNSGLSDSQVLDFTRANFADLYAAVKAQGLTGAPRYLNTGLSSDQLRAATQANFTDLYTLLGGANGWLATEALLKTQYAAMSGVQTPHSQVVMPSPPTITTGAGTSAAPAAPYTGLTNAFRYANGTTAIYYTGGGEAVTATTYRRSPVATHGSSGGNTTTALDSILSRDYIFTSAAVVAFRVLGGDATNGYRFIVNNQYVSLTPTVVSSAGRQYIVLDFGSQAPRSIALEKPLNLAIDGVHVGASDTVLFPSDLNEGICFFLGDSFTAGVGAGNNGDGLPILIGESLGFYNIAASGVGSTGYVANNSGSSPTFAQRVADDINRMKAFGTIRKLFIQGSTNDIGLSGVEAAASSLYDAIRGLLPAASITVIGPADVNAPSACVAGFDACEAAMQAAIGSRGGFHYLSLKGKAYTKSDSTHGNAAGYVTLQAIATTAEKAFFGL